MGILGAKNVIYPAAAMIFQLMGVHHDERSGSEPEAAPSEHRDRMG